MKTQTIMSAVILLFTASLNGAVVFSHSGNTDPTSEGWGLNLTGSGTSVGSVTNDLGSGIDAWFTDDDGTIGSNTATYFATPTASQIADGNTLGWILSARLRVVDVPDAADTSVTAIYRDGTTSWQMHFGSDADGDPIAELATISGGPSITLEGSSGGYHLYELVYDPSAGSADLFVDGVEVISDYTGFALGATGVLWGAGSSADTGQGNFAMVSFSTVPEPSAALMLLLGALLPLARRRKI